MVDPFVKDDRIGLIRRRGAKSSEMEPNHPHGWLPSLDDEEADASVTSVMKSGRTKGAEIDSDEHQPSVGTNTGDGADILPSLNDAHSADSVQSVKKNPNRKGGAELHPDDAD